MILGSEIKYFISLLELKYEQDSFIWVLILIICIII